MPYKVIHSNNNYEVRCVELEFREELLDENQNDVRCAYHVFNKNYDVIEQGTNILTIALGLAEHWNYILECKTYINDTPRPKEVSIYTEEGGLQ